MLRAGWSRLRNRGNTHATSVNTAESVVASVHGKTSRNITRLRSVGSSRKRTRQTTEEVGNNDCPHDVVNDCEAVTEDHNSDQPSAEVESKNKKPVARVTKIKEKKPSISLGRQHTPRQLIENPGNHDTVRGISLSQNEADTERANSIATFALKPRTIRAYELKLAQLREYLKVRRPSQNIFSPGVHNCYICTLILQVHFVEDVVREGDETLLLLPLTAEHVNAFLGSRSTVKAGTKESKWPVSMQF
jgi:hypothetical protein